MDVRYVNPFILSVGHVFKTMMGVDIQVGKPFVKDPSVRNVDVSAIIGFSGDAAGAVVLCFSMRTAASIATKFAGVEMNETHPDFADALGEVANMVAGNAKARFTDLKASISLPNVVVGRQHGVMPTKEPPRLALPGQSSLGEFTVDISMLVESRGKRVDLVQAASAG